MRPLIPVIGMRSFPVSGTPRLRDAGGVEGDVCPAPAGAFQDLFDRVGLPGVYSFEPELLNEGEPVGVHFENPKPMHPPGP
jgi:hypothetical protein